MNNEREIVTRLCDDCDELVDEYCMIIDPWGVMYGWLCDECNASRAERQTEVGG